MMQVVKQEVIHNRRDSGDLTGATYHESDGSLAMNLPRNVDWTATAMGY